MVETTTAEILLALFSFLGSALADIPDRIDELVRVVAPTVYRESHMSVEEARLDRFWCEYYAAMARFNKDMSKLDWVGFHKNHGLQFNVGKDNDPGGGSGRIQFAPVVVVPRMEWSAPPGAKLGSAPAKPGVGNPFGGQLGYGPPPGWSPSSPSFSPVGPITLSGMSSNAPPPPTIQWAVPNAAPVPAAAVKTDVTGLVLPPGLVLHVSLVESEQITRKPLSWICQVGELGTFRAGDTSELTLATGTAKDLMTPSEGKGIVQAKLKEAQAISIGTTLAGRITPISTQRVRLDLTLEKSDVDSAGKDNVLITSKTYRLAQQLQLGKQTKIVLQSDAAGEPRIWLEVIFPADATTGFPALPPGPPSSYRPVPWGAPPNS